MRTNCVILCLFICFEYIGLTLSQTFLRDCNDPIIVAHNARYQHSYCFHACGGLVAGNPGTAVCAADGVCACPCSATAPMAQFGTDICPPMASDPPDPDPTALPRCMATCAARCPGGVGQICSEVESFPVAGGTAYAKICTCICPPASCTFTTTTTTVAPTTQVSVIPVLIKPIILKKIKYWITKSILLNLVFFGTILKLIIIKVGFLYLLTIAYFVLNYIQSSMMNIMYSYVDGLVRLGQFFGLFMQN